MAEQTTVEKIVVGTSPKQKIRKRGDDLGLIFGLVVTMLALTGVAVLISFHPWDRKRAPTTPTKPSPAPHTCSRSNTPYLARGHEKSFELECGSDGCKYDVSCNYYMNNIVSYDEICQAINGQNAVNPPKSNPCPTKPIHLTPTSKSPATACKALGGSCKKYKYVQIVNNSTETLSYGDEQKQKCANTIAPRGSRTFCLADAVNTSFCGNLSLFMDCNSFVSEYQGLGALPNSSSDTLKICYQGNEKWSYC